MTIMIIDDSMTMRKITGLALKNQQYEYTEAENGLDAVNKLSNCKIDLFIVDVNMPVMNGMDFVRQLRSRPDYYSSPVIMLTTENDEKIIQEGRDAGVSAWMVKPFNNDRLIEMIKSLLP